jgi:hypothetical protein
LRGGRVVADALNWGSGKWWVEKAEYDWATKGRDVKEMRKEIMYWKGTRKDVFGADPGLCQK